MWCFGNNETTNREQAPFGYLQSHTNTRNHTSASDTIKGSDFPLLVAITESKHDEEKGTGRGGQERRCGRLEEKEVKQWKDGFTWLGTSGSSSSMSMKTSSDIKWGVSPIREHTHKVIRHVHSESEFSLSRWHLTYVSIPLSPPPSLVPLLAGSGTPPASGLCTDPPRASSQTDGYRWLWWRLEACKGPRWGAAGEKWNQSMIMPTWCFLR